MVLFGAVLLAAWQSSESPRSTSFLAVGVLCVIVMLTLAAAAVLWMFLIVPLLCAVAYVLSTLGDDAFVEPKPERGPEHDVR